MKSMPPESEDAILEGLPPNTHWYVYEGRSEFLAIMLREHDLWLRGETAEFVVFTHLDDDTFQRDFIESSEKLMNNSWKSYCAVSQSLHARMKSKTHEEMVFAFHDLCRDKLIPMCLGHALHRLGTVRGGPEQRRPTTASTRDAFLLDARTSGPRLRLRWDSQSQTLSCDMISAGGCPSPAAR